MPSCSQAARQVKGILNKLTPENFDRLLQQIIDIINDAEVLHASIANVFENAVAQPTFSFMYAQLCDKLSQASLLRLATSSVCIDEGSPSLAGFIPLSTQKNGNNAPGILFISISCVECASALLW